MEINDQRASCWNPPTATFILISLVFFPNALCRFLRLFSGFPNVNGNTAWLSKLKQQIGDHVNHVVIAVAL